MRFTLQLVLKMDEPEKDNVTLDIATFDKDFTRPEHHIGLSLAEAKNVLQNLQKNVVEEQINKFLQPHSCCNTCRSPLKTKDNSRVKYRTLYGTLNIKNPRYYLCQCQSFTRQSVTPLSSLLMCNTSPELCYLEAKWASLMSYGMTVDLLKESFPIDEKLSIETVRKNTLNVAKKINELLGE